ncbi:MAG TPA: class I SAM-dependent methyltransferase [Candidatus Binatus sp.]|nr:class I SAM-dependent methyltransferase [Candidatus Binatus sp.]
MPDSQSFDGFAADYDRFSRLEPQRLVHWLLTQLPAHGGRALDAGCGSGRHTRALAEHFDDVVGVDISEPLIDIARQRPGPHLRYLARDLMAFTDGAGFDLVFSSATLHHVSDLDAALLHLRGMVRAGGTAILIDNVASQPTPPRWVHVAGAVRNVPTDVVRLGWSQSAWLLRFRISVPWLDHLAGDRYLSRQAFERRYGSIFPEARFENLGYAHALVWAKKNPATVARGREVRREP